MLAPIVKWSGGKSDEIKHFEKYIPKEYNYYLEPFFGGGAVYFYLSPEKAVVSDVHPELVNLYNSIKKKKSDDIYQFMEKNPNLEAKYYEIRDELNDISLHTDPNSESELESAKRFYYIRKTCYRGMLRYNRSGYFNVPFGRYKTINYDVLKQGI